MPESLRVAVVGGGLFGCTAALELTRAGHKVDIYEQGDDVLCGASRASCGRVHHGYHYPRAEVTARAAQADAAAFTLAYPEAVWSGARHHYAVARGGLVSGARYLAFLRRMGLPFVREIAHSMVRSNTIELSITVPEALIHVGALRLLLRQHLRDANIAVLTNAPGGPAMPGYDATVVTAYGLFPPHDLQFEVTEVAVVRLQRAFMRHSIVILDGPFACIDPLPGTDMHLLYDVTHSVHHTSYGTSAEVPPHLIPLVNRGCISTEYTHVEDMLTTARRFFYGVTPQTVEYCGSMFTVRAVLPNVNDTDERPTLIERQDDTIWVLSGKLDASVTAAHHIVDIITPNTAIEEWAS